MKTPHIKEPWFAVEYAGFVNIQDGPYYENRNLLDCSNWKGEDILDEETIRANGQRIVECVNAMTGIETPAEFPILGLVMENRELKDKIKSMQSDHEKELSKIKEGVEQIMRSVVAADPTLMDICLKIIREDIDKVLTNSEINNKTDDTSKRTQGRK